MVLPILYSFRRCPYAMRARLALAVSGQAYELREVVLANKPAALLQASSKGTVPVLVLPDGSVIDQSLDIMLWALAAHDPEHWLPPDSVAHEAALALIAECDGAFKGHLDRYKYPSRYNLPSGEAHRTQGAVFLQCLDTHIQDNGHLTTVQFGVTDAAIAPFVRQFAHTNPTWFAAQPWPHLQAWLSAFEQSARYLAVMGKHAPWVQG